jgi:hypothetical protein
VIALLCIATVTFGDMAGRLRLRLTVQMVLIASWVWAPHVSAAGARMMTSPGDMDVVHQVIDTLTSREQAFTWLSHWVLTTESTHTFRDYPRPGVLNPLEWHRNGSTN